MKTKNGKEKMYLHISAGRGPAECCWVVAQVVKRLIELAKSKRIGYEIVSRVPGTEMGTLSSCLILLKGDRIKDSFKDWEGTIQWIGKSHYRKFHKRKNWFVGASLYAGSSKLSLNESDIRYQSFRASGPGGQHRNKVETAVRATHNVSGLTVTATESKSQHQNKKLALEKMKAAFELHEVEMMQKQLDDQWKEHLSLKRGNPVKVFKGSGFK